MPRNCFCTIITEDYLPFARTLNESLRIQGASAYPLFALVISKQPTEKVSDVDDVHILYVDEVCSTPIAKQIQNKYFNTYIDGFRWCMKPVLINYLIQQREYDNVIYLDCDLFFFDRVEFLFEKLNKSSVLLTPHWRSSDPHIDPENFQMQYNSGLYNGGFIAANKTGTKVMDWWAMACEFVCEKNTSLGYFDDQTHLNLFPIFFEGVQILKHRGCNVASWNRMECKRAKSDDGVIIIADQFPLVFIHFTTSTIRGILNGKDDLLRPHLNRYEQTLKKYGGKDVLKLNVPKPRSRSFRAVAKSFIKKRLAKWLE